MKEKKDKALEYGLNQGKRVIIDNLRGELRDRRYRLESEIESIDYALSLLDEEASYHFGKK